MNLIDEIYKHLQIGNIKMVQNKTQEALDAGFEANEILNNSLISAMSEIGEKFKNGKIFIPEVMLAAKAMQAGINCLKPKLIEDNVKPIGKIAVGTVKGDQHDIGKNLVAMMMVGSGFEVIDLGTDVPVEKFIKVIKEQDAKILALSALLTTTMPQMKKVIEELVKEGIRDNVKVMVGGAPVSEGFAKEIGADCYTKDAGAAAQKARELMLQING